MGSAITTCCENLRRILAHNTYGGLQAGAALAAVALAPEAERSKLAETLRQNLFTGKTVTQPDPEMVKAYHAPGAYLDRLEAAFEQLRTA